MSNIREYYKVQKSDIQESYERQIMLKMNKEYEDNANKAYVEILEFFKQKYPNVPIHKVRAREKSPKSMLGKVKNLQIERLSKLFVLEGIKDIEKEQLFELFKERVEERKELKDNVLERIKELLFINIENVDISQFIREVIETNLSSSTKTALLRILKSKIEESNLENKNIILQQLENKYGETRAKETGIPEYDLLRNESIEQLKQNAEKRSELYDVQEFLRSKDLRGMKIVIGNLPQDFTTDNTYLKNLLKKRNETTNDAQRQKYEEECIIELSREFVDELSRNEDVLEKMNVEVIKDSKKHKCKTNGYVADHIKFQVKGIKQQTFELQVKSKYVEEIATGEGNAAHTKRPGKSRVLPSLSYGINFIKELQFALPKYTSFIIDRDGKYVAKKCSLLENTMLFFEKQLKPNSKEYQDVESIISEYESTKEAII